SLCVDECSPGVKDVDHNILSRLEHCGVLGVDAFSKISELTLWSDRGEVRTLLVALASANNVPGLVHRLSGGETRTILERHLSFTFDCRHEERARTRRRLLARVRYARLRRVRPRAVCWW